MRHEQFQPVQLIGDGDRGVIKGWTFSMLIPDSHSSIVCNLGWNVGNCHPYRYIAVFGPSIIQADCQCKGHWPHFPHQMWLCGRHCHVHFQSVCVSPVKNGKWTQTSLSMLIMTVCVAGVVVVGGDGVCVCVCVYVRVRARTCAYVCMRTPTHGMKHGFHLVPSHLPQSLTECVEQFTYLLHQRIEFDKKNAPSPSIFQIYCHNFRNQLPYSF